MLREDHTAMQSPPYSGKQKRPLKSLVSFHFHSWEGIFSGRFDGLRGANDLREIPYLTPRKVFLRD